MLNAPENVSSSMPALQTSERRCENPDCNVNKLISLVPKRKTTQFVVDPVVIDKPMLVNGFTAVFQVDGSSARLLDIKNPNGENPSKTIYRIIPNSHVHVVNYVVVDTDETYLKKITENDPATIHKLLTSQKESADQMLKKIMTGQGSSATAAMTTVVSTINNNITNVSTQPAVNNNALPAAGKVVGPAAGQKNPIQLPVRMHPNLKITAVTSGEASTSSGTTPYITPVPLTNLQAPASNTATPAASINPPQNVTNPPTETVDK